MSSFLFTSRLMLRVPAWYVYEAAVRHGGIAAVPLNARANTTFDKDGVPRCPIGLRMHPTYRYAHPYGYHAQRYRCPLLFPEANGQTCKYEQFCEQAKAVQKASMMSPEAALVSSWIARVPSSKPFTINVPRANASIVKPKNWELNAASVHNKRSVANLNTLIYLVINVRALQRAKSINQGLLQIS